jgi:anti-sigma B factor antagonist
MPDDQPCEHAVDRLVDDLLDRCHAIRRPLRMSAEQTSTEGMRTAVVTVRLVGDYDLARERELVEQVLALDLVPSSEVRLDMSAVSFVDSCGLRGLLAAQAYLEGRGCRLRLLRPSCQLSRIIAITSLGEILRTVDDDADGDRV